MRDLKKVMEEVQADLKKKSGRFSTKKYLTDEEAQALGRQTAKCKTCGKRMIYQRDDGKYICHYCETVGAENERFQREAEAEIIRRKKEKLHVDFKRFSLIPKDLLEASFENYRPQNKEQEGAKEKCIEYVRTFDPEDPRSMYIYGEDCGTGKSHLAYSISQEVIKKGYSALFINMTTYLDSIRETYNPNSKISAGDILEAVSNVDLLVIDEMGFGKRTEWGEEKEYALFTLRQGKHNIMTSNLAPVRTPKTPDNVQTLSDIIDYRLVSRLMKGCGDIIEIHGPDMRFEAIRKK
ncbi:ATP-binding protein [Bacillus paralicheniformis]|uniref:ATP-binding protein n=1 Tax=Bacillus paralicheniformis TaxID=1648923 RepID=UPI003A856606